MRNRGFYLAELAVIVAVIGVLLSLAVPAYASARRRSTDAACAKNREVLDKAKFLWMLDNGKVYADEVYFRDIAPEYVKDLPLCPTGGSYHLNGLARDTTCSAHDAHAQSWSIH